MRHTRLYSDAAGESHFADVSVDVEPVDFAPPAPPLNMAQPVPAVRMISCGLPRGWIGDWHPTPQRQYWVQLSGELDVEVSDGEVRRFRAGGVLLLEDVSGRGHLTRVVGSAGVEALFVQLPAVTQPGQ